MHAHRAIHTRVILALPTRSPDGSLHDAAGLPEWSGRPVQGCNPERIKTMRNVTAKIEGDFLVIRVNVGKDARAKSEPSKSGKTKVLASTSGFVRFEDIGLSLNATVPLD